ncbi:MAG: hypothetical protein WB919_21465 [Candidatus Sulfotelmatobacter sp.]
MSGSRLILFLPGLITAGAVALALSLSCGSQQHQLQSITLAPQTADARDYPNGQVPFVATGHYSNTQVVVTPMQASWGALSEQIQDGTPVLSPANGAVSVDANGLAQCASGASGTFQIGAWAIPQPPPRANCAVIGLYGDPCSARLGTATLTCP